MTPSITRIDELDLSGKTVLVRADLNVPIEDGKVTSDIRLKASLATIRYALKAGAGVLLCSHLGRPEEGRATSKYSLKPVAEHLEQLLGMPVGFSFDYLDKGVRVQAGHLTVLDNVRFNIGEKKNSESLSKQYADLCDVFVMDAFGTAHRAQSSTAGVIDACKDAQKPVCVGLLLAEELSALRKALHSPKSPVLAVVGGSKVSTKLEVLHSLADICDTIIVGGGIANTFLAAKGVHVGASLYEPDLIESACQIMQKTQVLLPDYVVVADKNEIDFENFLGSLKKAKATVKSVADIGDTDMILDTAEASAENFAHAIKSANTILWNGPLGVFEVDSFGGGTKVLSLLIAESDGYSVAGGGDTLAAIEKYGVSDKVDYLSTGGGAFLEFVEGKTLPAIAALQA